MTFPKIISGGQTGVDRGALDVTLNKGVACGIHYLKTNKTKDDTRDNILKEL